MLIYRGDCLASEDGFSTQIRSRYLQTLFDVFPRVSVIQGGQLRSKRNPLLKLP